MSNIKQRKEWVELLKTQGRDCLLIYEDNFYINYLLNRFKEDKPLASTTIEKLLETLIWYQDSYEELKKDYENLHNLVYGEES